MTNTNRLMGASCRTQVFYALCLLLPITGAQAQVSLSNPALRDSPFGPDVTDSRTAGYQVAFVSVDVRNQFNSAVSVTWSVAIDGTTVASATQTVNANSLATFIKGASPAPILNAGGHTITGMSGSATVPRSFTVTPSGNSAPTDITLSNSTVAENQPSATAVGTLSTTDPDAGNTFTYTLVSGAGSTDNASFTISGSTLRTAASFNYEAKSIHTVRVRTTDQGGLWHEKVIPVAISNVNETPSDATLSTSTVREHEPIGTAVGTISTIDPDAGNTFTYTLVSGAGSGDNLAFSIAGTTLLTAVQFDFENKSVYTIRVRTTDQGGLWYENVFRIDIAKALAVTTIDADEATSMLFLEWLGQTGQFYSLQSSTMAAATLSTWSAVNGGRNIAGHGSQLRIAVTPAGPSLSYRAVQLATPPEQLLPNGDFESWSRGANLPPDAWSLAGLGGATASIAQEGTIKMVGDYSAKVTRTTDLVQFYQTVHAEKGIDYWKGRNLTFAAWVYATTPGTARVVINDGSPSSVSRTHPGDGTWQYLSVSRTISSSAIRVGAYMQVLSDGGVGYFDGAFLSDHSVLLNGDFESWSTGDNLSPDSWTVHGLGIRAATVAKEGAIKKFGDASAKVTAADTWSQFYQTVHEAEGIDYWRGKTVTVGAWVYATTPNTGRLVINDGTGGGSSVSPMHPGDGIWHYLSATRTIDASATRVGAFVQVFELGNAIYVDGIFLNEEGNGG